MRQSDLGVLGWEVEAGDDDVLGFGLPHHAAIGQDAGRREHDALDRGARCGRAGRVEVLGSEQRQVAEQAALGAADGVGVAVRDAQRSQRPAPDAGLPRERAAVDRLHRGEREPDADLDAPAHRHLDAVGQRRAVSDGVAEVPADRLVETGERVRREAARGVGGRRHCRRGHESPAACLGGSGSAGRTSDDGSCAPMSRRKGG